MYNHLKNLIYILFVQCGNYIFPLLTIPLVSRIFGPSLLGVYSYLTYIISYYILFVSFGFDYTGIRRLTQSKEDNNEVFFNIFYSKLIVFFISSIIFLLSLLYIDIFRDNSVLVTIIYLSVFTQVLNCNWVFQANSDFKFITIISFFTKFLSLLCIFLFVKEKSDLFLYALIIQCTLFFSASFSFLLSINKYNYKFKYIKMDKCISYLLEDRFMFFSNLMSNLYTSTGVVLLGFFTSTTEVGLFVYAQKIIDLGKNIATVPLNMLIFPIISRKMSINHDKGINFFKRLFPLFIILALVISMIFYFFSDLIITLFFGHEFFGSIKILENLSFGYFAVFLGIVIGSQLILNLKLDKQFFIMQIFVTIFSLTANYISIPHGGANNVAIVWTVSEFIMTTMQVLFLKHKGINLIRIKFDRFSLGKGN